MAEGLEREQLQALRGGPEGGVPGAAKEPAAASSQQLFLPCKELEAPRSRGEGGCLKAAGQTLPVPATRRAGRAAIITPIVTATDSHL